MKTELLLHLGALLIGLSKVGFGGGVGAIATPVLATAFGARSALGVTLPLLFATDLLALILYRGQWDRRRAALLLPGTLLGIAIAAPILRHLPPAGLARVIGALTLVTVLGPMVRERFAARDGETARRRDGDGSDGSDRSVPSVSSASAKSPEPRAQSPGEASSEAPLAFSAGLAAGFCSTLAHLGGMLVALYLLPLRLSNATFVATASVVYCAMNAAKLVPYVGAGLITKATLLQDLQLFPSLIAGIGIGFMLNRRVSGTTFGTVVRVAAIVVAVRLLWQGG